MINFIKSWEFWVTTVLLFGLMYFLGADRLSSFIQDSSVYGWAYVIHRLHKHHKLLKSITEEGE